MALERADYNAYQRERALTRIQVARERLGDGAPPSEESITANISEHAGVAQVEERPTHDRVVGGSTPPSGTGAYPLRLIRGWKGNGTRGVSTHRPNAPLV